VHVSQTVSEILAQRLRN